MTRSNNLTISNTSAMNPPIGLQTIFLLMVGAGLQRIETRRDDHLETYKDLIHNLPHPAAIVFPDEKVRFCNQLLVDYMGYELWELREMTFGEYTPADFKRKDEELFRAVLDPSNDLDRYKMTKPWFHKEGHKIWGHMTVIPVIVAGVVEYTIVWVVPVKDEIKTINESEPSVKVKYDNMIIQALDLFGRNKSPVRLVAVASWFILALALLWNFSDILDVLKELIK